MPSSTKITTATATATATTTATTKRRARRTVTRDKTRSRKQHQQKKKEKQAPAVRPFFDMSLLEQEKKSPTTTIVDGTDLLYESFNSSWGSTSIESVLTNYQDEDEDEEEDEDDAASSTSSLSITVVTNSGRRRKKNGRASTRTISTLSSSRRSCSTRGGSSIGSSSLLGDYDVEEDAEDTAGELWGENLDIKIDDAFIQTEMARRISHDHNSQKKLLLSDESSWGELDFEFDDNATCHSSYRDDTSKDILYRGTAAGRLGPRHSSSSCELTTRNDSTSKLEVCLKNLYKDF